MIAGWWRSQKLITLSVIYFYGSQVCFDFFQPPVWEGFHRGKRSWGPHWTIPGWVDWWVVKNRIWWRNTSIPTVNHPTTQFIWAFEFLFQREKTISWSWQFPSHSTRLTRPSVFLLVGCVLGEEWELQFIHSHSKFNFLQAGEPATWWLQLRLFEASFGLTILAVGRQL